MSQTEAPDDQALLACTVDISLPTEQRLEVLANLIIDQILEDKQNGFALLLKLGEDHGRRIAS